MKKIASCLILSFLFVPALFGQPLSAYTTFQRQFKVWDNGITRQVESLRPLKVEIGRVALPYIDNSRNFKIYYNGGVHKINDGLTNDFEVTDNLVAFRNARALLVWDQGKVTVLSNYCEQYYLADSLVLFFDGIQNEFRAYYNGHIYPIENFLAANGGKIFDTSEDREVSGSMDVASGQLPSVKVSDNIAAYVNYSNQFRIFYQGSILEQEDYLISNFDVGRNTVAYVDANQRFKVFHKGDTRVLDGFVPERYAAGDDLVAYVSSDNSFNIFYADSVYNMGYFTPDYIVRDGIVAFEDANGYFKVFYQGRIYTLENYFPDDLVVSYHSVAYVSRANVLRLFTAGKVYDVTTASAVKWRLDYDVLQYQFGTNMYKIFYQGETY